MVIFNGGINRNWKWDICFEFVHYGFSKTIHLWEEIEDKLTGKVTGYSEN